mmetsp:Transcript_6911/g.10195  ORF Transcript_6911/g.10195 Transcript_6911/m.10195 type:complete len:200 (+) Transcript_6911:86-685(+)
MSKRKHGKEVDEQEESSPETEENAANPRNILTPAAANPDVVGKIALLGPMGRGLFESLESACKKSRCISEKRSDDTVGKGRKSLMVNEQLKNDVLDGFREAVASSLDDMMVHKSAPAAIMKGKVKYYNRFGGQWRFRVQDVHIRRRPIVPPGPVAPDRIGYRGRGKKIYSAWDVPIDDEKSDVMNLKGETDVLVFDDVT